MDADLNKSVVCGHTNDKWHYRQDPPPQHLKRLDCGRMAQGWTEGTLLGHMLIGWAIPYS